MAAELTNIYLNVSTDKKAKRIEETVNDCRNLGIKFLPVDINKSNWEFTIEDDMLRIGLCAVTSLGKIAADAILEHRPILNIDDLYERIPKSVCSKRAMVPLIMSGALGDRVEIYNKYCEIRKEEPLSEISLPNKRKFELYDEDYIVEDCVLGSAYTTSPINSFKPIDYKNLKNNSIFNTNAMVVRVSKKRDRNNNMMCFFTMNTGDGTLEGVMFASQYAQYKSFAKKGLIINIKGKKQTDDSCVVLEIAA